MHWVRWELALASRENRGLDIGSLRSFNISLILKWIWRFVSFPNALWSRIIKAIYGDSGGLDTCKLGNGIWPIIASTFIKAKAAGSVPANVLHVKLGNGSNTRFWKDNWLGDGALKDKFARLFRLDIDQDCTIARKLVNGGWVWEWNRSSIGARNEALLLDLCSKLDQVSLGEGNYRWSWSLTNDTGYSVSKTRSFIDDHVLPSALIYTMWCSQIPRKINIFIWRLALDRLPTHQNLSRRGLEIESISCVSCNHVIESIHHIMFECVVAAELWRKVRIWVDMVLPRFTELTDWIVWLEDWRESEDTKTRLLSLLWFGIYGDSEIVNCSSNPR
ncbi:uncharacterized protein [Rutidosis leptorrhynchoides]|uniref:uncharacterized protein n=1 Tax=Rutidosis leptorrhynchoides TaxID=125765 RepID=UPI003A9A0358